MPIGIVRPEAPEKPNKCGLVNVTKPDPNQAELKPKEVVLSNKDEPKLNEIHNCNETTVTQAENILSRYLTTASLVGQAIFSCSPLDLQI